MFSYKNLHKRMSFRPASCTPDGTSDDQLICGVKTLSDQIRTMRHGGLPVSSRELTDANYDEDDVQTIDPSSDYTLDRFEKSEEIASQISTRMKQKHDEKLKHAEV